MELNERIKKIITNYGKSQKEFAEWIGESPATINNWVSGKRNIGFNVTDKILSAFPEVNRVWLLTGEGEMLKTVKPKKKHNSIVTKAGIEFIEMASGRYRMRVPVVPIYSYAKYIDDVRDAVEWDGDEFIDFPVDQVYHGNYMAFEIKGDSMDDDSKKGISQGDIVNARELSRDKWNYKLHTNKFPNWIIVTDTTILCKQIVEQNLETGNIVCHSLNSSPEYTDFSINLNEVRRLFNIVQRMTSSF